MTKWPCESEEEADKIQHDVKAGVYCLDRKHPAHYISEERTALQKMLQELFPSYPSKDAAHDAFDKKKTPHAIANLALLKAKKIPLLLIKRAQFLIQQVSFLMHVMGFARMLVGSYDFACYFSAHSFLS